MTLGDLVQKVTSELSAELLEESFKLKEEIVYQPVPYPEAQHVDDPVWRVRFHPIFDTKICQAFEINGEVVLGRGQETGDALDLYGAEPLGVSRRHALVRPTSHELFVIDLDSTNGTWLNGRSIGVNTPYSLKNGDYIRMGRLEVIIFIENKSRLPKPELIDHPERVLAHSILPQLERRNAISQAAMVLKSLTDATHIETWLIDDNSGNLTLEAHPHFGEKSSAAYTIATGVLATGETHYIPLTGEVTLQQPAAPINVYIPLKVGGVTFGVLAAHKPHHSSGFSRHEVSLLDTAAEFLAIALQNVRVHQAVRSELRRYNKLTTTLNYLFQNDARQLARRLEGYARMLAASEDLNDDDADAAEQLWQGSTSLTQIIEQLIDITRFMQEPANDHSGCDMVDMLQKVVDTVMPTAESQNVQVTLKVLGEPYPVFGDSVHLYGGIFNLVHSSVISSSTGDTVAVRLFFREKEVVIHIVDSRPTTSTRLATDNEYDSLFHWRQGSGLSLVMAQTVVEAHRGKFIVHNIDNDTHTEYLIRLPSTLGIQTPPKRSGPGGDA